MNSRPGEHPKLWYALAAIALVAGLGIRLQLASLAQTPGHGDSAFYYTVATNIVDGRGVVVDYVVYFFLGLVPLTHYAGDFWNPLAEILISLPMFVLGKSLFNALLASIAASMVPALVGFLAARRLCKSLWVGILAGILTFFAPFMIIESVRTEAIIFFGAFGSLALFLAAKGRQHWFYFLLAAMSTGIAHFIRQDGVFLLATLMLCILFAPFSWQRRVGLLGAAVLVHVLMISPMLIKNISAYGSPLQPGPASTAFMTSYEDFHAFGREFTWETLRAEWGIRRIVTRRLHTAGENLSQIQIFLGPVLLVLASMGAVNLALTRQQSRDLYFLVPPLIYWVLIFSFYTFVASFSGPGSLPKSLAVLIPFVCLLMVDLLASRIASSATTAAVVIGLAVILGFRGYQSSFGSARLYNQTYRDYRTVRTLATEDARRRGLDPDGVVIMARDVWDVYAATGIKSVMVPNNDLETILFVARHYGVEYILLPAPRKALEDIYLGTTPDERFVSLGAIPGTDWKLFRIQQ